VHADRSGSDVRIQRNDSTVNGVVISDRLLLQIYELGEDIARSDWETGRI
jgi:hypothetical protein